MRYRKPIAGILVFCSFFVGPCGMGVFAESPLFTSTASPEAYRLLKPLPEGLTSFGAITQDDYLYVFSGHNAGEHRFGKEVLSNHFRRIRFADSSAQWEELAMHAPAQSVALVSDGKYIYRIAGLSFRNSASEETDFDSTVHFARYNPADNSWTQLADLPEGRSSLDAAVVGRSIYVVGGWNLQGSSSSSATWHESMLRFDLDQPEAGWQTLPGPGYKIRALSVAAHGDRLVAMGGMTPRGIARRVAIFDTQIGQWTDGPDLPADHRTAGFATAAFATGGHLYNSGSSGIVYRLSQDDGRWEIANRLLFPRNFLRLIPSDPGRLIAVGGTNGSGRSAAVEWVRVDPREKTTGNLAVWTVDYSGAAKSGQALWSDGSRLISAGGNSGGQLCQASDSVASDEVFEFDLSRQTVRQMASTPVTTHHGVLLGNPQTSSHQSLFLIGGMGSPSNQSSQADIFEYDFESDSWTRLPVQLPFALGMHGGARYDDAIWLFGGLGEGSMNSQILHWWADETEVAPLPNVSLPLPRRLFGSAVVGDELFVIGGMDDQQRIVSRVDVFHLIDRTWRQIKGPHLARADGSVASDGKRIFLFGGYRESAQGLQPVESLEVYDLETNQWSVIADRLPGIDYAMRVFPVAGRLCFFGVDSKASGTAKFGLFDPSVPLGLDLTEASASAAAGTESAEDRELIRNAKSLMRKDIDKDGRLSRAELGSRMEEFFRNADADEDERLTYQEILNALKSERDP
jgi:N-acetylneuraminic acid mutarotase